MKMTVMKKERLKRGWSLAKVCSLTGIDSSALSKIERGLWPCCPAWQKKLSEAYRMAADELLREADFTQIWIEEGKSDGTEIQKHKGAH